MEGMYSSASILSFGKVPCTPVTGAYMNFFDVFGDVERVGTGSSHESSSSTTYSSNSNIKEHDHDDENGNNNEYHEMDNEVRSLSTGRIRCPKCYKHNACDSSDSRITFLQKKQVEILGALHEEIRILKSENADLKFQIHVILSDNHGDGFLLPEIVYRSKMVPSTPETYLGDLNSNCSVKDKDKTLELELESAAKMIEELKWVKLHYEKQIQAQETRIGDLERQLRYHKSGNCNTSPPMQVINSTESMAPTRPLRSGRQRSSSTNCSHELLSRRNSLQSLLPDDYKKAVATLPPILGKTLPNSGSPMNVLSANSESVTKSDDTTRKNRKSAFMHSPRSALGENLKHKTPPSPFIAEKNGHFNGATHLYYSK